LVVADPSTGKTLLGLHPIVPLDPATREGDRLVGPFSAVWYLVFVLPLFLFTPDRPSKPLERRAVTASLTQLARSVRDLVHHHGQVALFLVARMLYADGLGAVFAFGGIYAATVFGWGAAELGL
ncbi:MAG TPA: MFS transporter, partial [Rhizobiales bacterium]|nr:MFS transporter [Hyphomicrobiales bacterium]